MHSITLEKIAEITRGDLIGDPKQVIDSLETDSRRIRYAETAIFIAIRGIRHDGHSFVQELFKGGLRNFLIERSFGLPQTIAGCNAVLVEDTMSALHALAGFHRSCFSSAPLAITGSNGKTMVKEWLYQVLSKKIRVARSPKSYNSQLGVALSLWMADPENDLTIIEAGISQPGEMRKLEQLIHPGTGIITNIGQAHQENFLSLQQKVKEKLKLFEHCKTVYFCRDHTPIFQELTESGKFESAALCSWSRIDDLAPVYFTEVAQTTTSTQFKVRYNEQSFSMKIPFGDEASVENCFHIINYLLHQGYDERFITDSMRDLVPVAMRLEQVAGMHGNMLINDSYNSDINSLRIALDYQNIQKQQQKKVLILSDIVQSGVTRHELYREVGRLLADYQPNLLIGVGNDIELVEPRPENTIFFSDTRQLLDALPTLHLSDSSILIKGARKFGFEQVVGALAARRHSTVLEINLNHMVHNLNYFRDSLQPNTRIMVMVKALSYGSGTYEIANVLQNQKVDYLGVAFADEGANLREKGINLPIMVMAPTADNFEKVIEYRLEPEIFSLDGLFQFSAAVKKNQLDAYPIHIKIDSGMHRLGFLPEEISRLIERLSGMVNLRVRSIFTHLAAADNPEEDDFTRLQLKRYEETYRQLTEFLGYNPLRHALNSAGIERFPEAHFDMVRLGIGLHGISAKNKPLMTVGTLRTVITQIKTLRAGETVGYNRREKLSRDSKIAIVPIGYADGLDRKLGNRNAGFIVNNKKAPVIGDVCMDMCMLDITGFEATEGDEVVIFGDENPVTQLAASLETIPYEILTSISERVQRVYIDE